MALPSDPLEDPRTDLVQVAQLQTRFETYCPGELFEGAGRPVEAINSIAPTGDQCMSTKPHPNGGFLARDLRLPELDPYAAAVRPPPVRSTPRRRGYAAPTCKT